MVRAGVVAHPRQWMAGGHHEIQGHRQRYRIVGRVALAPVLKVEGKRGRNQFTEMLQRPRAGLAGVR
jgi:hypothetical protein